MNRKICVVTGSRAEYGLLYWLLRALEDDPAVDLQLVVCGMHLSQEFGYTYRLIEADGFRIAHKVEMALPSDTANGVVRAVATGLVGFSEAFQLLSPDVVTVLGDRFEILAAAQAAMFARIPIAHISGGEVTEGGIDDAIRHSLTKMAMYHFVSAEAYGRRVVQLGEESDRVFVCGDPGIESVKRMEMLSREELSDVLGFDLMRPFVLVTYHPETLLDRSTNAKVFAAILAAIDSVSTHAVLITKANADEGGAMINDMIDSYSERNPGRVYASISLGQRNYSSAMLYCDAVIGNSSSGIVEAPALKKPTVNIGDRQTGRLMAGSIISVSGNASEISGGIRKALSAVFQQELSSTVSLYGSGDTSTVISNTLRDVKLHGARKTFYDLPSVN